MNRVFENDQSNATTDSACLTPFPLLPPVQGFEAEVNQHLVYKQLYEIFAGRKETEG